MTQTGRGIVIGGEYGAVLVRDRAKTPLELGEIMVVNDGDTSLLLQVYDLRFGSQISGESREFIAEIGLQKEGLMDYFAGEREYTIAVTKEIAAIDKNGKLTTPKALPKTFSTVRSITNKDLGFLSKPDNPLFLGWIRSGSKQLDEGLYLDAENILTHHILIPAMTGRGKSNLVKVILWGILSLENNYACLVLDPHDEYYGRHVKGLKDHPKADKTLEYYSPTPPDTGKELVINLKSIKPNHLQGIVDTRKINMDIIKSYYNEKGDNWIEEIIKGNYKETEQNHFMQIKRKLETMLGIYLDHQNEIRCHSQIFSINRGKDTLDEIIEKLLAGKMVIIDTIRLIDDAELLIGSIISKTIFDRYLCSKAEGTIKDLPVLNIVLEEAPRALAAENLKTKGESIYSQIAREGRKFKIGLIAITQLTSIIPKTILTNMSTKIILGNELESETNTLIESSSQDLSSEKHNIGSLDIGEAIITSIFTKFAVPIKIPYFEDYINT